MIVSLLFLFSTVCVSQEEKIKISKVELYDILLSESEYKSESEALKQDTLNMRLIIESKDVIITELEKIGIDKDLIIKGLERALESSKIAYDHLEKNAKKNRFWRAIKNFLIGAASGAVALAVVLL